MLRSDAAGALQVGSPVYFRRIEVGSVVSSALDTDAETDTVTTRIFVTAPYDKRVHASSRFWNASGIDMSIGAEGVKIDTQSLVSILIGGIAFDTPEHDETEPAAAPETVFPLYESRTASEAPHFTKSFTYVAYFDQSVRGTHRGGARRVSRHHRRRGIGREARVRQDEPRSSGFPSRSPFSPSASPRSGTMRSAAR